MTAVILQNRWQVVDVEASADELRPSLAEWAALTNSGKDS